MTQERFDFPEDRQPHRGPPRRRSYQLGPKSTGVCHYCGVRCPSWTLDKTPVSTNDAAWARIAKTHGPGCQWVRMRGLKIDPEP
jgi:hypothetical protein